MSDSGRNRSHASPRRSPRISGATDGDPSTLYADLHRLASIAPKPVTPFRRAASAGPTPGSRPVRTPGTGRTPRGGPATRPLPARRAAPTTPHAIRALRERANAARTPGHVRRRSGRIQRETPRDILRDLSRVLARNTRPPEPSPREPPRPSRHSALDLPDVDEGHDTAPPRLSIALDMYDDDDSIHEAPPRESLLPNLPDDADTGTINSLEFGRRALSEDPRMMFNRRVSSQFADLNELGVDGEEYEVDGTFVNRRRTLNPDELLGQIEEEGVDETRHSDIDLGIFGESGDETEEPTFRFTIPPRLQAAPQEDDVQDEPPYPFGDGSEDEDAQVHAEVRHEDTAQMGIDDSGLNRTDVGGWMSEHDDDADLDAYREEVSAMDRSLRTQSPERPGVQKRVGRQRKALNISRFGLEYPSFPAATVKTLATGFTKSQGSKAKISKETLAALVQASDMFFEQIGPDLAAYAQHGGRKMIEESDVIAIMKRTRQVTNSSTPFSLAQKLLPRELLQQLRMEPLPKTRRPRQRRMETIHEDEND